MLDWQDLKYLVVLARTGSLSAAARQLKVDHATVGRRIAALETALNIKLVDRLARRSVLTGEGVAILALAEEMERAAEAVARHARGSASPISASVRISAPPGLAAHCLAPRIGELRLRHPGLKIILLASNTLAALGRGEADIALRLVRPREAGAVARRLGHWRYAPYAAPDYAARAPGSWEFIAFDPSLDHIDQQVWLRRMIGERRIAFEASDQSSQLAAARGGAGVALLPRLIGDADPGLVRVDLGEDPPAREMWLMTYPDLRRSEAVRVAMDFVARVMAPALQA